MKANFTMGGAWGHEISCDWWWDLLKIALLYYFNGFFVIDLRTWIVNQTQKKDRKRRRESQVKELVMRWWKSGRQQDRFLTLSDSSANHQKIFTWTASWNYVACFTSHHDHPRDYVNLIVLIANHSRFLTSILDYSPCTWTWSSIGARRYHPELWLQINGSCMHGSEKCWICWIILISVTSSHGFGKTDNLVNNFS